MEDFAQIIGLLFSVIAVCYAGIVIHELGHLCGCLAVGWKPLSIAFGIRCRKTFLRVGDLSFQVGLRPFNGFARAVSMDAKHFRLKFFIFSAAGPLATALFICGLYVVFQRQPHTQFDVSVHLFVQWLMVWQIVFLGTCLFPATGSLEGRKLSSDGLQMWKAITMSDDEVAEKFAGHCMALARLRVEQGRLAEAGAILSQVPPFSKTVFHAKSGMIYLLLAMEKLEEAKAAMTHLAQNMEGIGRPPVEVLDWLASVPLFDGRAELLDRGLEHAEQGLAIDPDKISLKGTKGALLIEKGEYSSGESLLMEALGKTGAGESRPTCTYYMALVSHRKGETARAGEYLQEAQKLDPESPVRERIEKEILGKPTTQPV